VADVDCTGEAKPLCDREGVSGFPTLKYGDPFALENYEGPRTYNDLLDFAQKALKPICSPDNLDVCDDDKKKLIEKYQSMSAEELKTTIKEEKKKLKDAQKAFDAEVDKLSKEYERLLAEKEQTIADIRSSDLKYLQAIERARRKENGEENTEKDNEKSKDEL
jgi:hypothetical protein